MCSTHVPCVFLRAQADVAAPSAALPAAGPASYVVGRLASRGFRPFVFWPMCSVSCRHACRGGSWPFSRQSLLPPAWAVRRARAIVWAARWEAVQNPWHLGAIKPRSKHYNLSFGLFRSLPGRTWPRDPFQRVRLEKTSRTHFKLAPETNYKAVSWPCPGLGQKS